jgi:hypothetical protein
VVAVDTRGSTAARRANQLLHAGVLAGNAAWSGEVVPNVPSSDEAKREARAPLRLVKRERKQGREKLPEDVPLGRPQATTIACR